MSSGEILNRIGQTLEFRKGLREYGLLSKEFAEVFARWALAEPDPEMRARIEGISEGVHLIAEALLSAAEWDTPDRPTVGASE